jgi:hypothetical protein
MLCFLMLLKVHLSRLDTLNLIASHLLRLLIWLHIGVHDKTCLPSMGHFDFQRHEISGHVS